MFTVINNKKGKCSGTFDLLYLDVSPKFNLLSSSNDVKVILPSFIIICHFIKMSMLSKRHFLFYFSKLQGVLQHVKVISLSLRKYWHIMSKLSNCHFKKIGRFLQCQGHLVYVFLFNGNVITCHFKQIAYFENVQLVHCQIWHSPISFPVIFYEVHRNCQGHLQSFV